MATKDIENYRIDTSFTHGGDDIVYNLTLDVTDGLTGNPKFPNLPVSLTDLAAQQAAFSDARTDARKGGTDRTRLKNNAKQIVVDSLLKIALYCMGEARHDLDALLSTGFEIVSRNHKSGPLAQPYIIDILNNVPNQLQVRGQGVLNGRNYKVRGSTDGGKTWTDMGTFNGARRMVLTPTVPGTTYMIEFCAQGGSTGQSPWSDPVSRMST